MAFLSGFSLGGLKVLYENKNSSSYDVLSNSFFYALLFLFIVVIMIYITKKLDNKPKFDYNKLINTTAEVSIPTTEKDLHGKITLVINGVFRETDCYSIEKEQLKRNDKVIIVSISDNNILNVKKYIEN